MACYHFVLILCPCQALDIQLVSRPLRTRPSIADESGGEEILYPRNLNAPIPDLPPNLRSDGTHSDKQPSLVSHPPFLESRPSGSDSPTSPPSAFPLSSRRAKKRTSDEFEMDQFGTLVSKRVGPTKVRDEKVTVRKHRSLNVSSSSVSRDGKGKERRRESVVLTINSNVKVPPASVKTPEKHIRQASTGSSAANISDGHHQRRVQITDFSHLPPSPSSTSIQQFLRHTTNSGSSHPPSLNLATKDTSQTQPSPNVAHSLLRGTQEGWSGLGDEATAEALRKLDGLSGKSARARASVASLGRASSSSRPGTPAGKSGGQWEGVSVGDSGKAKRASGNIKDGGSIVKDREQRQPPSLGLETLVDGSEVVVGNAISSDEQSWSASATEKTPKKGGSTSARSSFTPKRGSTSSTTYTSTPSSRDSASMSATTSMTSVSAASGRHSIGKTRRNSAGSDISSIHSSDAASLKDRVASIAINGDAPDDGFVPPVPPLPKDLSTYPPPPTSMGITSPSRSFEETRNSQDNSLDRTISLEVPSVVSPSQRNISEYSGVQSESESPSAVLRTPSKKWSFSSALNLRLSSSPSSSGQKSGFPLSPRSMTFGQQLRKSTSKDQGISVPSGGSKSPWEAEQPDAMLSAASLVSLSSAGSMLTPALPSAVSKALDRGGVPSRSDTRSSASTSHTTSALSAPPQGALSPTASVRRGQSKRLTPSSIPFFRRSSSQSMHLPSSTSMATSSSPTLSSGNLSSAQTPLMPVTSAYNPPSTSVSGSAYKKSSVLSLGLPSLLKSSSSRRSLHADAKDAAKEIQRARDAAEKDKAKADRVEKEKQKKDEKERSESRISALMGGRKRGKVYSRLLLMLLN
jgi:dual specificity tyrosine-phosphorylation-regulated kinase 2/3/4